MAGPDSGSGKPTALSDAGGALGSSFRVVGKLLTSTTAVAAFLLYFGFLSQAALYSYMGMPQIVNDYISWVEYGARAVVETLHLTFAAQTDTLSHVAARYALLATGAFWIIVVLFQTRYWPPVERWMDATRCTVLAMCGLVAMVVPALRTYMPESYAAYMTGAVVLLVLLLLALASSAPGRVLPPLFLTVLALGAISVFAIPPWIVLALLAAGSVTWLLAEDVQRPAWSHAPERPVLLALSVVLPLSIAVLAAIGAWRGLSVFIVLGLILVLWLLAERKWLQGVLRNKSALLGSYLILAAFVTYLAVHAFQIVSLGSDPGRVQLRKHVAQARLEAIESFSRSFPPDFANLDKEDRTDVYRDAALALSDAPAWRETLGPAWAVRRLAALTVAERKPEDDPGVQRYPTRPPLYQGEARELYGWVTLFLILSALALAALREWRRWLFPRDKAILATELHALIRVFLGPILLLMLLGAAATLPVLHGQLATEYLGYESVIVNLRQTNAAGQLCAPDPGSGWTPRKDRGISTAAEASPGAFDVCNRQKLEDLEIPVNRYVSARLEYQSIPRDSDAESVALAEYQSATDGLFDTALGLRCPEALQSVYELAPLGLRPSAASDYFWSRWREAIPLFGQLRAGYLLTYPSSSRDDHLVLFTPTRESPPWNDGLQWSVTEVRRECVEEVVIAPNLAKLDLDAALEAARLKALRNPNSFEEFPRAVMRNPGAVALDLVVDVFGKHVLAVPAQQSLVTILGSLANWVADAQFGLRLQAIDELMEQIETGLRNPKVDEQALRAAFTSLWRTGEPYAAWRLARLIEDRKLTDHSKLPGESITAIGQLAASLTRACDELAAPDCGVEGALSATVLEDWLEEEALGATADASRSATACTALGLIGSQSARIKVRSLLATFFTKGRIPDRMTLSTCISALSGDSPPLDAGVRRSLEDLVVGKIEEHESDVEVRLIALSALYRTGFVDEADWFVGIMLDASQRAEIRGRAVLYFNDLSEFELTPELVACISDAARSVKARLLCLQALTLTAENEEGDGFGVIDLLIGLASEADASMPSAACHVLREFQARGSDWVDFALAKRPELCEGQQIPEGSANDRWERNIEMIQKMIGGKAIGESLEEADEANVATGSEGESDFEEASLARLRELAEEPLNSSPRADRALELALQLDEEYRATLIQRVYFAEPASVRVLVAAQYLEDIDAKEISALLERCIVEQPALLGRRCALGLALVADDYAGTKEGVEVLAQAVEGRDLLADARCHALGEWALRGNRLARSSASMLCADSQPWQEERDPRRRWLWHIHALAVTLLEDASMAGDEVNADRLRSALAELEGDSSSEESSSIY